MLTTLPGAITSSERGRELALTRWNKSREAAQQGLIEGVEQSGIKLTKASPTEAWKHLIAHTVKTYMQSKNIRGMAEILGKLGIATGMLEKETEVPEQTNPNAELAGAITMLLSAMKKRERELEREVVDGEVTDV